MFLVVKGRIYLFVYLNAKHYFHFIINTKTLSEHWIVVFFSLISILVNKDQYKRKEKAKNYQNNETQVLPKLYKEEFFSFKGAKFYEPTKCVLHCELHKFRLVLSREGLLSDLHPLVLRE